MDHNLYHEIEDKAQILVDSLPYIRDFNQKIIIISFGCSNILTDEEEQEVMRDIALMKSSVCVRLLFTIPRWDMTNSVRTKRIAKMIEFCGVKAVGICGIDLQTIHMTLDNDYIPVITPNDIDNEDTPICRKRLRRKLPCQPVQRRCFSWAKKTASEMMKAYYFTDDP